MAIDQQTRSEILRLHREDPEALVVYNREDAALVIDILEGETVVKWALKREAKPRAKKG